MPLSVYERGFLVCEMAQGRQKLLAQPRLGAAMPSVNLPVELQSRCDKCVSH